MRKRIAHWLFGHDWRPVVDGEPFAENLVRIECRRCDQWMAPKPPPFYDVEARP